MERHCDGTVNAGQLLGPAGATAQKLGEESRGAMEAEGAKSSLKALSCVRSIRSDHTRGSPQKETGGLDK